MRKETKQVKHTPGPWFVENIMPDGPRIVYAALDPLSGFRDDVPMRFTGGTIEEMEQVQMNARLISAAPQLLEACKGILSVWKSGNYWIGDDFEPIIRAIAKAEGREE